MANVLVAVRQLLPQLAGSARRVATVIVDDPQTVIDSTITDLARICDTSASSVARFCVRAGYSGYKELRIAVAAAHSRDEATRSLFRVDDAEIDADDEAAEVIAKIAFQEARAIEETARHLDVSALDAVAVAVRRADRVVLYGAGSSGHSAMDLHHKLSRIGLPASHWSDAHLALTATALTGPGDVVIGISHSGGTREAQELLMLARRREATTVAITNDPASPVAQCADFVLATSARESRYRTGAMTSRLAQLAVIDFLTVRLLQQDPAQARETLRRTYDAIAEHRLIDGHE